MDELNNKLDGLNELITRIDAKILEISTKLDAVIAAIHEYDDDQLEWPEPNDALLKAAGLYNEELNKKYGESSFEAFQDETELNKRMDIIGQNGNEGSHYVTNEEADEDAKSNNPAKHTGGDKKRNKRKYYKPKQ
jgi:histidinol phosphatase-like PHP family hydrolase